MKAPVSLPTGPIEGAPSRPEPDVIIPRGPDGSFDLRHPGPEDIVLAVEVASDARRLYDDRKALERYVWNNVRYVWIVNISASVIEVYTRPTGPAEAPVYESDEVKGRVIRSSCGSTTPTPSSWTSPNSSPELNAGEMSATMIAGRLSEV